MEEHGNMMPNMSEEDSGARRRFNEIIERIEHVRAYLGLNRSKFCRSIGMSPQTYNNFIGPQGTKPNIQLLHGVVTRFGVNPMWLFTGNGAMFLPGHGEKPALRSIAARGMGEEVQAGFGGPYVEDQQELASLLPLLRRVEALLQTMDGRFTPLLNRFTEVFRRYMQVHPEEAVSEIVALLETVERRLANHAAAGEPGSQTHP